jgi:REP element-mobilizing transposase RayT
MMASLTSFWHSAHGTHCLPYHVVFVPKYRHRHIVLQRQLTKCLTGWFYECCGVSRWYFHELEILPDHVHLLVQLPAKVSLAKIYTTLTVALLYSVWVEECLKVDKGILFYFF